MPGYKHKGGYTRHVDMLGKKFNKLTEIDKAENIIEKNGHKSSAWKCLCECGQEVIVRGNSLRTNKTKSCGCLNRTKPSNNITHHLSNSKIYTKYKGMKQRCLNKNSKSYKYYGGKGFSICDEWLGKDGFMNFYNWAMANGYSDELSLEREDVAKNYGPDNCKWIPQKFQAHNKTNSYVVDGIYVAKEARKIGVVNPHIARERCKLGWDVKSAITVPKGGNRF